MTKNNFLFRRFTPGIPLFFLAIFMNYLMGCHYYKVSTPPPPNEPVIGQALKEKKYIILHQGSNAWHLKDIVLNDEKKEMSGVIEALPKHHVSYKTTNSNSTNRFKPKLQNPVYEVHIYISEYKEGENSSITIPLSSISKIDIFDKAVGATVASHVFTTIGILAGVFVIVCIIIILTKSSCPFVYISDGNSYRFMGEMYGGAIYSSLERDDYLPLAGFNAVNEKYELKISNELLERQYTNLAELMVIEHPDHSNVIIDKQGTIQTLLKPDPPVKAVSGKNTDQLQSIRSSDSSSYLFNEDNTADKELSSLIMSFKKPADAKTGKLILNAKNSLWLDYIYGKFNEQFGTAFNTFAEKQKKVPAEKNIQWMLEQGIPLSVYIETEKGWKFVDYFNVIGPLASRDMVMPIDLSGVKGDEVNIKIECGFMFWEIDYAAMDFSENIQTALTRLTPSSARDEKGLDVSSLLSASDDKYFIQPEPGNEVLINYPAIPAKKGFTQSVFLHTKGYYEYIRDYKNKPDLLYLNSFKKKGAFTKFSKMHYNRFTDNKDFLSTAFNAGNEN